MTWEKRKDLKVLTDPDAIRHNVQNLEEMGFQTQANQVSQMAEFLLEGVPNVWIVSAGFFLRNYKQLYGMASLGVIDILFCDNKCLEFDLECSLYGGPVGRIVKEAANLYCEAVQRSGHGGLGTSYSRVLGERPYGEGESPSLLTFLANSNKFVLASGRPGTAKADYYKDFNPGAFGLGTYLDVEALSEFCRITKRANLWLLDDGRLTAVLAHIELYLASLVVNYATPFERIIDVNKTGYGNAQLNLELMEEILNGTDGEEEEKTPDETGTIEG